VIEFIQGSGLNQLFIPHNALFMEDCVSPFFWIPGVLPGFYAELLPDRIFFKKKTFLCYIFKINPFLKQRRKLKCFIEV